MRKSTKRTLVLGAGAVALLALWKRQRAVAGLGAIDPRAPVATYYDPAAPVMAPKPTVFDYSQISPSLRPAPAQVKPSALSTTAQAIATGIAKGITAATPSPVTIEQPISWPWSPSAAAGPSQTTSPALLIGLAGLAFVGIVAATR